MGSTNISEIIQITNKTNDTYFMYVWDNAHEGRYSPFDKDDWYYPSDGRWLEIKPGVRLRADDCGIPDGGKAAGKSRVRVIFKAEPRQRPSQGDPGRGLAINRIGLGDGNDALMFSNHDTGETLSEIPLPTKMHQNLLLLIDDKGAQFVQKELTVSGEHKMQQAFKEVGEALKLGAEIFLEVIKRIPEA